MNIQTPETIYYQKMFKDVLSEKIVREFIRNAVKYFGGTIAGEYLEPGDKKVKHLDAVLTLNANPEIEIKGKKIFVYFQ